MDEKIASAMFEVFRKFDEALTACWRCTKTWEAGGLGGGGVWEFAVYRTRHKDSGECVNCGYVNTKRQATLLAKRLKAARDRVSRRWRRMVRDDNRLLAAMSVQGPQ